MKHEHLCIGTAACANTDDRDIEYFYASRLAGEPLEGVEDRHFHRFEPRQVRITLTINL